MEHTIIIVPLGYARIIQEGLTWRADVYRGDPLREVAEFFLVKRGDIFFLTELTGEGCLWDRDEPCLRLTAQGAFLERLGQHWTDSGITRAVWTKFNTEVILPLYRGESLTSSLTSSLTDLEDKAGDWSLL